MRQIRGDWTPGLLAASALAAASTLGCSKQVSALFRPDGGADRQAGGRDGSPADGTLGTGGSTGAGGSADRPDTGGVGPGSGGIAGSGGAGTGGGTALASCAGGRSGAWDVIGSPISLAPGNTLPWTMELGRNDEPIVGWNDGSQSHVARLTGSRCGPGSWTELGAPRTVFPDRILVAVDHLDRPVRASGLMELAVDRWTGSSWEPMGAPLDGHEVGRSISHAAVEVDPAGNPVVALYEGSPNPVIFVWRWMPDLGWVELTDASGVLGQRVYGSSQFSMALDLAGNPVVAWRTFNAVPLVARFDGSKWIQVGPPLYDTAISPLSPDSWPPDLQIDGAGRIFAAWTNRNADRLEFQPFVGWWSGSSWITLPQRVTSPRGEIWSYGLALKKDGTPLVAGRVVTENLMHTHSWNGQAWEALAPPPPVDGFSPTLIRVDSQDRLVAVWEALDIIYVERFQP